MTRPLPRAAQFQAVVRITSCSSAQDFARLDLLQAFALDPAKQALDACMTFHIGSAVLGTALLRLVVVALQAVVEFQRSQSSPSVLWSL
jgi:hypothetical protein